MAPRLRARKIDSTAAQTALVQPLHAPSLDSHPDTEGWHGRKKAEPAGHEHDATGERAKAAAAASGVCSMMSTRLNFRPRLRVGGLRCWRHSLPWLWAPDLAFANNRHVFGVDHYDD
jgi:hypothetical protein